MKYDNMYSLYRKGGGEAIKWYIINISWFELSSQQSEIFCIAVNTLYMSRLL